jgi:hypothetical protein
MGARARVRVLEKFSLDAEANAIAAVYRGLGLIEVVILRSERSEPRRMSNTDGRSDPSRRQGRAPRG